MALARGRYIARMDADDVSHPSRFEKQVALMDSTAADVCGCHFLIVNESGKTIDSRIVPLVGDAFTVYLMVTAPFAHSSVMLRTAFFRHNALEYGGLRYAEDYDLWARAWEKGAIFAAVDEFVFTYRDHAISTQKRLGREYSADTKSIRRRFVTRNLEACERAVINLLDRYDQLTRLERIFLVWGAYAVSMRTNPSLILKVLGRSDRKSTVLALLSLAKGV
jgi:glycosyltransferase involved in cell wall biosynthesis